MLIVSKRLTYCLQDLRRPEPCSYLQPGQQYQGTQRVSQASATASEDWGVQVCIEVQLAAPSTTSFEPANAVKLPVTPCCLA